MAKRSQFITGVLDALTQGGFSRGQQQPARQEADEEIPEEEIKIDIHSNPDSESGAPERSADAKAEGRA